jgi:NADH-quinone oxidoreductase subunit M
VAVQARLLRRSGQRHVAELKDINGREWLVLGVRHRRAGLGIYPKPLTDLMQPSIAKLAMQIASSKLL